MKTDLNNSNITATFLQNFELQENIFNQITDLCSYAETILNGIDAIVDTQEKLRIFQLTKNLLSKLNECTSTICKNYISYLQNHGQQCDLFKKQIATHLIDLHNEISNILQSE